jgi:hypothetical protein
MMTSTRTARATLRWVDWETGLSTSIGPIRMNNRFWNHTLRNLAAYSGVEAQVQTQAVCVDHGWQWSRAGNVWQNAGIRSGLYLALAPLRWLRHRGCVSVRDHPVI